MKHTTETFQTTVRLIEGDIQWTRNGTPGVLIKAKISDYQNDPIQSQNVQRPVRRNIWTTRKNYTYKYRKSKYHNFKIYNQEKVTKRKERNP